MNRYVETRAAAAAAMRPVVKGQQHLENSEAFMISLRGNKRITHYTTPTLPRTRQGARGKQHRCTPRLCRWTQISNRGNQGDTTIRVIAVGYVPKSLYVSHVLYGYTSSTQPIHA